MLVVVGGEPVFADLFGIVEVGTMYDFVDELAVVGISFALQDLEMSRQLEGASPYSEVAHTLYLVNVLSTNICLQRLEAKMTW